MMTIRGYGLAGRLALMLATTSAVGGAPGAKDPAVGEPVAPAAEISTNTLAAAATPAEPPATNTADRAAPQSRPRLSPQLAGQISSSLPIWRKPPPGKPATVPPPPPAPDVVRMAPVIVNGTRLPRAGEKEWLTPEGRDYALVKRYLSALDSNVLNRFTLPLIGVSKEARARMMYEEDKRLEDLRWINDQIDELQRADPQAAKELQQIRNVTFSRTEP